jgi:hypothetical protein
MEVEMTSLVSYGFPQRSRNQRGTLSALLHAKPLLWCVLVTLVGVWFAIRNFYQPADAADLLLLVVIVLQLYVLRINNRKQQP